MRHFSAGESEERIGQLTGILVSLRCLSTCVLGLLESCNPIEGVSTILELQKMKGAIVLDCC